MFSELESIFVIHKHQCQLVSLSSRRNPLSPPPGVHYVGDLPDRREASRFPPPLQPRSLSAPFWGNRSKQILGRNTETCPETCQTLPSSWPARGSASPFCASFLQRIPSLDTSPQPPCRPTDCRRGRSDPSGQLTPLGGRALESSQSRSPR